MYSEVCFCALLSTGFCVIINNTRILALRRHEKMCLPSDSTNVCLRTLVILLLRRGKCRMVNIKERYSAVREFRNDKTSGTEALCRIHHI